MEKINYINIFILDYKIIDIQQVLKHVKTSLLQLITLSIILLFVLVDGKNSYWYYFATLSISIHYNNSHSQILFNLRLKLGCTDDVIIGSHT